MADTNIYPAPLIGPSLWQRILRWLTGRVGGWGDPDRCAAFTTALVSLAAKMAKADGISVPSEAEAFEKFLDVEPDQLANVRHVYAQATQDTAGFEAFAERIAELMADDPDTKRRVFECLFFIACSDGILHPAEDQFLHEVARRFGYDDQEFQAIRATFVHDPGSPYAVLDIAPDASDRAIKSRYKKLVAANHPDRLIAAGAPTGVVKAATAKVAAFNVAYDQIQQLRGQNS